MDRRTFSYGVAGVASLGGLAGCLGSRERSSSFTVRSRRLSAGNVTEAFAEQPADFSGGQSALVDELVANGTAVRSEDQWSGLFEDGTYVVSNGTYYLINRVKTWGEVDQYEYSITELATDPQAFETYINRRRNITRISPSELSPDTREVFDQIVRDDEYDASTPFSETDQDVLDRLDVSQKEIGYHEREIAYNGSYYEVTIRWSHGD